jgi:hypothetical protein
VSYNVDDIKTPVFDANKLYKEALEAEVINNYANSTKDKKKELDK